MQIGGKINQKYSTVPKGQVSRRIIQQKLYWKILMSKQRTNLEAQKLKFFRLSKKIKNKRQTSKKFLRLLGLNTA